jgi:hypothetical protein
MPNLPRVMLRAPLRGGPFQEESLNDDAPLTRPVQRSGHVACHGRRGRERPELLFAVLHEDESQPT